MTFPSIMIVPCNDACYLNCLSVQPLHKNSEHSQKLQHFLLYLSVIQTEHIPCHLLSASFKIKSEAGCFQATLTPLISTQYE